jgi:hypothetical protein
VGAAGADGLELGLFAGLEVALKVVGLGRGVWVAAECGGPARVFLAGLVVVWCAPVVVSVWWEGVRRR